LIKNRKTENRKKRKKKERKKERKSKKESRGAKKEKKGRIKGKRTLYWSSAGVAGFQEPPADVVTRRLCQFDGQVESGLQVDPTSPSGTRHSPAVVLDDCSQLASNILFSRLWKTLPQSA